MCQADKQIVAASSELFASWPGATSNPNNNGICGQQLEITWGGKTLRVEVADECPSCDMRSLDMSKGVFEYFADLGVGWLADGYTSNITWSWVESIGTLPELTVT